MKRLRWLDTDKADKILLVPAAIVLILVAIYVAINSS